jgi:phosphate/sulfate permease
MRNKVFGTIGVLWGGAIVVSTLIRGVPSAETSYSAGQFAAFLFGFLLVGAGVWTLRRQTRSYE